VQRGNVSLSNLQLLNALLYVAEHGCKWRGLPISQRRILSISTEEVVYQSKDTRTKSFVENRCTLGYFVDLIAQHVPGHHRHSPRRAKPKRQSWAASLQKHFGRDPLKDAKGQRMRWIGSLPAADFQ
jgi:hypothetical protein